MTEEAFTPFATLRQRYQAEFLRRAPEHIGRLDWSPAQIAERQRAGLRALLAVARERSPFHARRLRGIDPDRFELEDLARLPVMTKSELMDDFDDALTDPRVTRALCERALADTKDEPRAWRDFVNGLPRAATAQNPWCGFTRPRWEKLARRRR